MYIAVCVLGSENGNLLPHIYVICTVSVTYFAERYQSQINKSHKRSQSPSGETCRTSGTLFSKHGGVVLTVGLYDL